MADISTLRPAHSTAAAGQRLRRSTPAAVAVAAASLLAACAPGPPTTTRPSPELPRPTPEPVTPIELPPERGVNFTFATGSNSYTVRSVTEVAVGGDSVPPGVDSVTVTASVLLAISSGDSLRSVAGSVFGSTVETGQLIRQPGPVPRATPPASVPFEGVVAPGRSELTLAGADSPAPAGIPADATPADTAFVLQAEACTQEAAFASTLLSLARQTLPTVPRNLTIGATWRDSVTMVTCRASVVLITTTLYDYELMELTSNGDIRIARLNRRSRQQIAGSGEQSGLPVRVLGQGSGENDILLDLNNGRLLSSTGGSTVTLQHTAGNRTATVEQRTTLEVQLAEPTTRFITPP